MVLFGRVMWFLITIFFIILCIPFIPILLLEAIFEEGRYDDRRDYYRRYL